MMNDYSRRKFLKTVVISAGAIGAGGLSGCGGGSSLDGLEITKSFDPSIFPQSVVSGDPKPDSIILWTRVENGSGDQQVFLQVAKDPNFEDVVVAARFDAEAASDHCVKVKVTDLDSYQTYYYRFETDGYSSRTGRFKTAPKPSQNQDIKFGFTSCQDYTNGYYNSFLKFLEPENDDIDFIVQLGDYIYETTGDVFQGSVRSVTFDDPDFDVSEEGSIENGESRAAATVSQYRFLYKKYRSDLALQRLHEKFAFICIWDDHEYSDDAWGETATYFDGRRNETDETRRTNAEVAFFEYMPLDVSPSSGDSLSSGQARFTANDVFPSQIYRRLQFGTRLTLQMADFRTYRPDHLIPEDGFPGEVVMTETNAGQTLYAMPNDAFGFKADVDSDLGSAVADVQNPTTTELNSFSSLIRSTYADSEGLAPYVTITSVTNSDLGDFFAALDNLQTQLGRDNYEGSPTPSLQNMLITELTSQYEDRSIAVSKVSGNIDSDYINATLNTIYSDLLTYINDNATTVNTALSLSGGNAAPYDDVDAMFVALATVSGLGALDTSGSSERELPDFADSIPGDSTWGFGGFGMSYYKINKTSLYSFFGARYLVNKPAYELLSYYQSLILENSVIENAWGTTQETEIFNNINNASTDWVILGSSVSSTSLILDARPGGFLDGGLNGAGISAEAFPRTPYFMNADHWDGFVVKRASYISDAFGNLGHGTFQDNNVVLISGDIHATFITDHGANTEGTGRCLEFTVPGASSASFGTFTADAVSTTLGLAADDPNLLALVSAFGFFLTTGVSVNTISPHTINYTNPASNGVAILELSENQLTGTMHLLDEGDSTLIGNRAYSESLSNYSGWSEANSAWNTEATSFSSNFTSVSRSSTKAGNGQNGALVEV